MVYGDGDESDCTWREIQLGLIWGQTGGFVAGEHDDPLPTDPIGSAGSTEWSLKEEEELRPQFPELEGHYESTDGAGGQFQGETNYGQIGRGASGPSRVRRHGIIDVANHGKNVGGAYGGFFQARLNDSVASSHELFPRPSKLRSVHGAVSPSARGRGGAAEADDLVRRLEGLRLLFGEALVQAEGALQNAQEL